MSETFLDKAKADGKVFVKTMNFVGKLGKLKLDMHAKKQERERLIRSIGETLYDHYCENKSINADVFLQEAEDDLSAIEKIDAELASLEGMVDQAKVDLKGNSGSQKTSSKDDPPHDTEPD